MFSEPNIKISFLLCLIFCLMMVNGSVFAKNDLCPVEPVINGIANLKCWDGVEPIELSGRWNLEYHADQDAQGFTGLADVPMRWKDFSPPLASTGRGVYRIVIELSESMEHLGLKLPRSNMARKILLIDKLGNKRVIFDTGLTGLSDQVIVNMRMPIVSLGNMEKFSELVIIVRNSESIHGGIEDKIILAPIQNLIRHEQVFKGYSVAIATILAVFFVFNIALWIPRRKDSALLTLGLLAFLLSLRQTTVSGILFDIFPNLSTQFDASVGWYTFFGSILSGSLYFRFSYPKLVPNWLIVISTITTTVGVVLFVTQPLYIVQYFGNYYRPFIIIVITGIFIFLAIGLRSPTRELKYTLLSSTVLLVGISTDIFYFQVTEYYSIISVSAASLLIFIGIQTMLMSQKYLDSLRKSAKLTSELLTLNTHLEDKVKERTTELAIKNRRLNDLANTDALTGLANRRAFDNLVAEEITKAHLSNQPMVIGIIDIDHFKTINDTFGHSIGDNVLKKMAKLLIDIVRTTDSMCRWGGEEFCILFPETSAEEAFEVSERIRVNIEHLKYFIDNKNISITISTGLAQWSRGEDIKRTFKSADKALYYSKYLGRNRVTGDWQMTNVE